MGRKSAGFKQYFVDSACQIVSLINRKLCLFFPSHLFARSLSMQWYKMERHLLFERKEHQFPPWMIQVLSHELQGDTLALHMGALFSSVAGGFPQFHIPVCHLTLDLTEKALRPLLTPSQPLKTSSSDHQNFMFGLLQNQSGIPSAVI